MKTQLIKTTGKFILVSDETPKEGDRCFSFYTNEIVQYGLSHTINCSKIISEDLNFSQLSEEECKRIGWIDSKILALKDLENFFGSNLELTNAGKAWVDAYSIGFKKAQELNDKQFSLEDVIQAIELAQQYTVDKQWDEYDVMHENLKHTYSEHMIIQSLKQPKVWDVEIEMEGCCSSATDETDITVLEKPTKDKLILDFYEGRAFNRPKLTNNQITITKINE